MIVNATLQTVVPVETGASEIDQLSLLHSRHLLAGEATIVEIAVIAASGGVVIFPVIAAVGETEMPSHRWSDRN